MIFQDPYASLNLRMTVFDTLAEALVSHRTIARAERRARVIALMATVGLLPGALNKYPHEVFRGPTAAKPQYGRIVSSEGSLLKSAIVRCLLPPAAERGTRPVYRRVGVPERSGVSKHNGEMDPA